MSNTLNQGDIMRQFNDRYREDFNKDFFIRSEDDIIEELKNVILSCQRDKFFTLKVDSFKVVEDYNEINKILFNYEEKYKGKGNKRKDNQYEYIDLKDSDIKLLIVKYFIKIKDMSEYINVIIAVPRIVNKYYFRISGNIYSAMYQIVDASTYNNSTSSSKNHSVTLKTIFMPIKVYRAFYNLKTTKKETLQTESYISRIFNKSLPGMKYILAKFGFLGALNMLGIGSIYVSDFDPDDVDCYTFNKNNLYINVPKILFDNDAIVQSFVYTVYKSILKDTTFENIYSETFWIESLGSEFGNSNIEKGISILDSFESVYDISTHDSIKLPEEDKCDMYHILRWMMREFSNLMIKDNLDVSIKKILYGKYIASLYAMKISKGIYRVSDIGKKATLDSIKKAINISPLYLLGQITKCKLVNYRNMVNDNDALTVLKFTYKGIAGIGESNNNSVPNIYRFVHISHLGRVDPDSSSASDPGMSGTLCPLGSLYDNSFSDYSEPNEWDAAFSETMNNYKLVTGKKELLIFRRDVLNEEVSKEDEEILDECIDTMTELLKPVAKSINASRIFSYCGMEDNLNG